MASAQKGVQSDYKQLLGELSKVIHQFLCSRFGHHAHIEDCVQEALIAIHEARHTFDPHRPFRPWMFAIVRYKAIDFFRRRRTIESTLDQVARDQLVFAQGNGQGETGDDVAQDSMLGMLTEQHREVLILTKIIGFSISETAKKLDISQSAVKVRVHRAVKKLRQLLEEEESWTRF
jgi:RNA polymerase sigma-70 factor (ECF subfamily)